MLWSSSTPAPKASSFVDNESVYGSINFSVSLSPNDDDNDDKSSLMLRKPSQLLPIDSNGGSSPTSVKYREFVFVVDVVGGVILNLPAL